MTFRTTMNRSQQEMQQLSIGAVAALTHIPAHTLRKWESRHGIAVPLRSETGRRVYTQEHVEQLQLIKMLIEHGHSLAYLAEQNIEQLRELAGLHEQPPARVHIQSLCLVGPNVCWLMSGSGMVLHRHPGTLSDWLQRPAFQESGALVVESNTLPPATVDALLQVSESLQLLIVVYKYASRRTLVRLQERGVVTIVGPAEDLDILAHIDITKAPDADIEQPAPRFSIEELGRIAALSPGLLCECPNHIAKLLMDITSFEQYSQECQDTDPAERALHQKLGEISARARALLEDALVAVATADGISLRTNS
jgi:DNA-binding transcriptional MerR regulator